MCTAVCVDLSSASGVEVPQLAEHACVLASQILLLWPEFKASQSYPFMRINQFLRLPTIILSLACIGSGFAYVGGDNS